MSKYERAPRPLLAINVFLGLCCVAIMLVARAQAEPPAADRPNIVVIVADDLGWADVGYHNPEMRTPRIDALAETGVELDCHYVMPVCTPTRVALLTGRYPSRFGNHCTQPSNERALPPETPTLASMLQDAGYKTALFGKWHLGSKPQWGPNHYGFDYSYGSLSGLMAPYDHRYRLTRPEFTQTFHRNHEFIDEPGHSTDLVIREAIHWIEQQQDTPFFAYVPFFAVHVPLVEVPRWHAANSHIESADRRHFAAAATHMDDAIGQLLDALARTGQRENTLVVFLSDNGGLINHRGGNYPPPDPPLSDFSSNLPLRGQKAQAYEGGIRVPALAHWPGVLEPHKVDAPLHVVDWLPTIASLIGHSDTELKRLDGKNIWPVLTGEADDMPDRPLYWVMGENRRWVALRQGAWKIVKHRRRPWELYNLDDDPFEKNNLAEEMPDKLSELIAEYETQRSHDRLPPAS